MLILAFILGFSLGYAFGLTGFDHHEIFDSAPGFPQWMFRVSCVVLIFILAMMGGLFQTGLITDNIDQSLGVILGYAAGVFCHHELNETEINFGIVDKFLGRFGLAEDPRHAGKNTDQTLIRLAAYFYRPFLSEMDISYSLKQLRRFRAWDSLDIQIVIAQSNANPITPNRLIERFGLKGSSKLKRIFSDLLQIGSDNAAGSPEMRKRLRMVATSAGLTEIQFDKIAGRFDIDPPWQRGENARQSRHQHANQQGQRQYEPHRPVQNQKSEKLAIFGLQASATFEELKSAFRKMAIKYHPDRNMTKDASTQQDAREKMTEINLAYDWLQANW
ncbi:MAG: DnaJ domain-containing protein [Hellea sp.]|nr:DnaJ domain-containing protein [Hellea sp.]